MQKFKMPALKVQTPLSYYCMQIKTFLSRDVSIPIVQLLELLIWH